MHIRRHPSVTTDSADAGGRIATELSPEPYRRPRTGCSGRAGGPVAAPAPALGPLGRPPGARRGPRPVESARAPNGKGPPPWSPACAGSILMTWEVVAGAGSGRPAPASGGRIPGSGGPGGGLMGAPRGVRGGLAATRGDTLAWARKGFAGPASRAGPGYQFVSDSRRLWDRGRRVTSIAFGETFQSRESHAISCRRGTGAARGSPAPTPWRGPGHEW
jgi:hypothetical protein